jgi:uncharacterized protein
MSFGRRSRPTLDAIRIVALAAVVVAGAAVGIARAQSTPIPSAPTAFVTDRAGFLSPAYAAELSRQLEDYERGTGHQLIVWIDRTTGGVPLEDWTVKAFKAWGVGRKGHNDGVALFIFSDDRKLRIEVGYGLEGNVPDARAGRIIQNDMVPRIRAGDRDGAVKAGVDSLIAAIGGAPEPRRSGSGGKASLLAVIVPLLFFVGLLLFSRRHPWGLLLIGSQWGGGGWGGRGGGGGGWSGGGGFSGGGGSSGGGGASGGW